MRRLLLLFVLVPAIVLGGWKWDDKAQAYPSGSNCTEGQLYYAIISPFTTYHWYRCYDGWLRLVG